MKLFSEKHSTKFFDRLKLRWLGNISIRPFTGWDFRTGSGLLKSVIKTLFLAGKNVPCLFFLVVTFSQKRSIILPSWDKKKKLKIDTRVSYVTINFKLRLLTYSQRHANQRALDPMLGNHGSIVNDILSLIFIFYLQMINSGHAADTSTMADKKRPHVMH